MLGKGWVDLDAGTLVRRLVALLEKPKTAIDDTLSRATIPLEEHDNVLHMLWALIGEVEMKLTDKSSLEKHIVSSAYNVLNRIGFTKNRPHFESFKETHPKKYEVGYAGEMIGVYTGATKEAAIQACKEEIAGSEKTLYTPPRDRLKGTIAVEVKGE